MIACWRGFLSFCALRPGERAALSPKNERAGRRGRRGAGVLWAGAPGSGMRISGSGSAVRDGAAGGWRCRWAGRGRAQPARENGELTNYRCKPRNIEIWPVTVQ